MQAQATAVANGGYGLFTNTVTKIDGSYESFLIRLYL